MEARSARLLNFPAVRSGRRRRGSDVDHLAEAKKNVAGERRERQRAVTEELMRSVTDIDPAELEQLRVRAERKPDRVTPPEEVRLHEGAKQLAEIRLKGAAEAELTDPFTRERLIIVAGSDRGGIERISYISPDALEMATGEGIVAVKPVYVPDVREVEGRREIMFRNDNTVSTLSDPEADESTHPRHPRPSEIAMLISLLRDGERTGYLSQAAAAEKAAKDQD